MPKLIWNDEYSVGIDSIDSQHKNIVKAVNSMIDSIYEGKTEVFCKKLKKALVAYSERHFKYEEDLMSKYQYPGIQEQKNEHKSFLLKFNKLYKTYMEQPNDYENEMKILDFLRGWLFNHIKLKDKKYSDFLLKKGVK
ncbi:MAG: hemerythrin family protein [SAR324 cluster bacterium]|nr:hemerythrin family protein [SAR324 cluster bacterium]